MLYQPPPMPEFMLVMEELWDEPMLSLEEIKIRYPFFGRLLDRAGIDEEYWQDAVFDYIANRELYKEQYWADVEKVIEGLNEEGKDT